MYYVMVANAPPASIAVPAVDFRFGDLPSGWGRRAMDDDVVDVAWHYSWIWGGCPGNT